jgi:hypothetical protein
VFDPDRVSNVTPIFRTPLEFVEFGTTSPTGIDEIGGVITGASLRSADCCPTEATLFEIQFEAATEGVFTVDGANGYALIFGDFDAISPTFQSASLNIVPEPAAGLLAFMCLAFGPTAKLRRNGTIVDV